MNGLFTCLCAVALIWAGLALIGGISGRNRRYQQHYGNDASFWAGIGLAWLFWNHQSDSDLASHTTDAHLAEQYLDGDIDTPDMDGDVGGDWGDSSGGDWGGGGWNTD